jgi:hypothetical protein
MMMRMMINNNKVRRYQYDLIILVVVIAVVVATISLSSPSTTTAVHVHGFQRQEIIARIKDVPLYQQRRRYSIKPFQHQQQQHDHRPSSSSTILSASNNNSNTKQLAEFVKTVELQAITASESWIVDSTKFLSSDQSNAVQECLEGRADIASFRVGGFPKNTQSTSDDDQKKSQQQQQFGFGNNRVRYVFTNPDLGYDTETAQSEYSCLLRIDNININECPPWPNIMTSIGIQLDDVGDILIVERKKSVYLVVSNPTTVKTCIRLLPKEVPGSGVTVTQLDYNDIDSIMSIPINEGEVVEDMELKRLDKRAR